MDSGLNVPASITFLITDKLLMVIGEVGIGLIPDTLPPITQVVIIEQ